MALGFADTSQIEPVPDSKFGDRCEPAGLPESLVVIVRGPKITKYEHRSVLWAAGLIRDKTMPKQKTHKGMKRRFKVTASGKARHRSAFRGHLLSGKSAKRKRHLRNSGIVEGADAKHIVEALRPSL